MKKWIGLAKDKVFHQDSDGEKTSDSDGLGQRTIKTRTIQNTKPDGTVQTITIVEETAIVDGKERILKRTETRSDNGSDNQSKNMSKSHAIPTIQIDQLSLASDSGDEAITNSKGTNQLLVPTNHMKRQPSTSADDDEPSKRKQSRLLDIPTKLFRRLSSSSDAGDQSPKKKRSIIPKILLRKPSSTSGVSTAADRKESKRLSAIPGLIFRASSSASYAGDLPQRQMSTQSAIPMSYYRQMSSRTDQWTGGQSSIDMEATDDYSGGLMVEENAGNIQKRRRRPSQLVEAILRKKERPQDKRAKDRRAAKKHLKQFRREALKAHNKHRKQHGCPSLKGSAKLELLAQDWAEQLAKLGRLEHRDNSRYGENIYSGYTSYGSISAKDVVGLWYSEIKSYDFNRQGFSPGIGHFTQVVWKGSKELGVGLAVAASGSIFVVANYHPAGNVIGRFEENVHPVRHR